MGAKQSDRSLTNYFKLKAKTSDTDPTPFFGKEEKVGDKWTITEKFDSFEGHLVSIEHETYEYEKEEKHKLKIKLKDDDGTVNMVQAGLNSLVYSLLNCLANTMPEKIEMNVTLGKLKVVEGKEGKRYPNMWVKNNGQEVKWKYQVADLPRPVETKVGKKTVKDDSNVIEFWLNVLKTEIQPNLKEFTATATSSVATKEEPVKQETARSLDNASDDLPF